MVEFIFQIEKEEFEDKQNIIYYCVNKEQNTTVYNLEQKYSMLCKKNDFQRLNIKNSKITINHKEYLDYNENKVIKVEFDNKELFDWIKEELKDNNSFRYEADLSYDLQNLINNNIPINLKSFDNRNLKFEEINADFKMKTLSIDIETIGGKDNPQIIMISSHSYNNSKVNKVYLNCESINSKTLNEIKSKKFKEFEVILLDTEKDMLEKFQKDIIDFSPQIILGWNVIDFDFAIIKQRMQENNIEFKFSKYKGENKLRINSNFFRDSTLNIPGVLVFDGISLLKSNFITFEDYKLNTVAKNVIGDEKINLNQEEIDDDDLKGVEDKIKTIEKLFIKDPIKLIEYNFKDSKLVSQINKKLGLIELMMKRSILTNTPLQKVKSPIASLDIMYLKRLHEKGFVANSNFNFSGSNQIEGAYVIEPEKGFYTDVFVFDFKSLYPSIIMTFNIDPFTFKSDKIGSILAPNGAVFSKEKGILPELILKLYNERDIAKKENDLMKSYALKITMNSFYGAMASSKSRFHNRDVGGAITSFGREIIVKAKEYVENLGYNVVYGDTDSIFVEIPKLNNKNLEDKKKQGEIIENKLNLYFDNWVKSEFDQKSYLTIEMEKIFSKFFIASKKRYVGFNQMNNELKFVGMEAVRGDWTDLARKFQIDLVKLIFKNSSKEDIKKFILKKIKDLENGKFDEELIYKKKITKPLAEYTKMTPPHVKAAREVKNFNSRLVKYVMTLNGPKHISLFSKQDKLDYKHYIDKQLNGVSDDLLKEIGLNFKEIVEGNKQKSLDSFF